MVTNMINLRPCKSMAGPGEGLAVIVEIKRKRTVGGIQQGLGRRFNLDYCTVERNFLICRAELQMLPILR